MKERNKNRDILGFRPYQIWAVVTLVFLMLIFICLLCYLAGCDNYVAIEKVYIYLGIPILGLMFISYFEEIKKFFRRIF
jgi:hypothetical protein